MSRRAAHTRVLVRTRVPVHTQAQARTRVPGRILAKDQRARLPASTTPRLLRPCLR